jgi:hypothetical protein
MSLLDYFAAKALQGMCANGSGEFSYDKLESYASQSYLLANAMLKEREQSLHTRLMD